MNEEMKLDEKTLEKITGGISADDLQAAEIFRVPFIDAYCSRCSRCNTECSYPSGDPFDTTAMYYVFKDKPGCPWIVPK